MSQRSPQTLLSTQLVEMVYIVRLDHDIARLLCHMACNQAHGSHDHRLPIGLPCDGDWQTVTATTISRIERYTYDLQYVANAIYSSIRNILAQFAE